MSSSVEAGHSVWKLGEVDGLLVLGAHDASKLGIFEGTTVVTPCGGVELGSSDKKWLGFIDGNEEISRLGVSVGVELDKALGFVEGRRLT